MAEATRMEAPAWVPHPAVTHTAVVVPVSVLLLVATPTEEEVPLQAVLMVVAVDTEVPHLAVTPTEEDQVWALPLVAIPMAAALAWALPLVATPTVVVAVAMEDHPQVTMAPLPKGITERRHKAVMVAEEAMALLLRATMVLLPLKEATAEAMALLLKAIMALHPLKEATANPKQSIERRPAAEPTRKPCSLASTTCVINVVA